MANLLVLSSKPEVIWKGMAGSISNGSAQTSQTSSRWYQNNIAIHETREM